MEGTTTAIRVAQDGLDELPYVPEPPPLARPPARLLQGLAFLPAKVVDTQIGQARVCQLRQPE